MTNTRSNSPPSFILSGESNDEEIKQINEIIISLGGKVLTCKNDQFVNHCTHIVCFSFQSTVKIMAGLASGKWLVEKKYILDSYKADKWLAEDAYEVKEYNEVAKFCRLQKGKLFAGSQIYIETHNSSFTKIFIRVLIAGGALVFNKNEVVEEKMKVQFALTDAHSLNSVIRVVGSATPILRLDFIKHTVIYKHNPKHKRKFLLNPNTAKLSDLFPIKNEGMPVVASFLGPPHNQATAKSRVRRRMQTPLAKGNHRYPSVASYFLKKEKIAPDAEELQRQTQKGDSEDDVKIIQEIKGSSDSDCILIDEAEAKDSVKDSATNDPPVPSLEDRATIDPSVSSTVSSIAIDTTLPSANDSNTIDTPSQSVMDNDKSETPMPPRTYVNETSSDSISALSETPLTSIQSSEVSSGSVKSDAVGSKLILQEVDTNSREGKLYKSEVKRSPLPDDSIRSDSSNEHTDSQKDPKNKTAATFIQNRDRVLKCGRASVNVGRKQIRDIACKFVVELNTSQPYLSSTHIPVYSYPTTKRVYELDAKECLYASSIGQGDLLITQKKVGRYKVNVAVERPKSELVEEEDRNIAMESLEWLQMRLRTDIVPNVCSVSSMIYNHIIKCSFRDVSSRALSILGSLLYLHPPCNKQMRDFYITVFQKTASSSLSASTPSNQKGWEFVKMIANDLLSDGANGNPVKFDPKNVDTANVNYRYDTSVLMDFVTQVLELDLVHYNEKPITVTTLLTFRLFWPDRNQNPSVSNSRVKDVIALWIESANAAPRSRRRITKLMSLLLEMIWKWSEVCNPFVLASWPLPRSWEAVANAISLQFKAIEDPQTLPTLLQSLRVPWQQMLVTSLAFRSSHSFYAAFKLSLPSLKSSIAKEVKLCEQGEDQSQHSCAPHSMRVQFLCLMFLLYAHGMGIKFAKAEFTRQFISTLNKEGVLHTYAPVATSENEGAKRRKLSMSPSEESDSCDGEDEGENEKNPAIEDMVNDLVIAFKLMNPVSKEIRAMKNDCLHIAQSQFIASL